MPRVSWKVGSRSRYWKRGVSRKPRQAGTSAVSLAALGRRVQGRPCRVWGLGSQGTRSLRCGDQDSGVVWCGDRRQKEGAEGEAVVQT